jgi:aldehyde dehydrogenase (NAD+)
MKFVHSIGGKTFGIYNPATGEAICNIDEALAEDVDLAVQAVQNAFPTWSEKNAFERAIPLSKLAKLVLRDGEELARLDALSMGKCASPLLTELTT